MLPNLRALAIVVVAAAAAIAIPGPAVIVWNSFSRWLTRLANRTKMGAVAPAGLTLLVTAAVMLVVPDDLMPTRATHLAQAISGWQYGGTILTFRAHGAYTLLTDDPGIYLLAPLFSHFDLPPELLKRVLGWAARIVLLGFSTLTLRLYAGVWRERPAAYAVLCGCTAAAALLGVHVSQQYWMPLATAWGAAELLAPCVDHRPRSRPALRIVAIVLLTIVCAIARESAALVGAVALVTYAVCAGSRDRRIRGWAAIGAIAVVLIPGLATRALYDWRDASLRAEGLPVPPDRGAHPRWHSIYIGLAIPGAPFGYQYADEVAIAAVHARDPQAVYPTARYDRDVRALFMALAVAHPLLVARQFIAKGAIMLAMLFIAWAPAFIRERRARDGLAMTMVRLYGPFVLAGLAPGVLVAPVVGYAAAGVGGAVIALGCAVAGWGEPPGIRSNGF